jgi:hypothetical protein
MRLKAHLVLIIMQADLAGVEMEWFSLGPGML